MAIAADASHSKTKELLVGWKAAALPDVGLTMINSMGKGYSTEQTKLLMSYHIAQLITHPHLPGSALLGDMR